MKKFTVLKLYLAALITGAGMLLGGCRQTPPERDFYEDVRSVDKLVFAGMSITKTAKYENSEWYKVGKRIAVYSYDTYMRAYIDMSLLTPDDIRVDEEKKSVQITLPAVQTELVGRDMTLRKEYENIGLFRSNMDSRERAEIKEKANESLVSEVKENPKFKRQLTEAAERKARGYFEALFARQGYRCVVVFKK